ncbi:MAG: hypothetical protein ACYTKC_03020 [Planctomycetota bacterium]|jgi:hypothetical protein
MSWSCVLAVLLSQELPQELPRKQTREPTPAFVVANPADTPRTEILRVSVPFRRGSHKQLHRARIPQEHGEEDAAAVPLVRWPDGSIALAQLQVRVHLGAKERRRFLVRPGQGPCPDPGGEVPWHYDELGKALPLFTEVQDPWGQTYRARLRPDLAAGPSGLLCSTPLVRVRRYRGVHRRVGDENREFLGLVALLTSFRGERRAELTILLDNAAYGSGPVLGPVRFKRFSLVTETNTLRVRPRLIRENLLRPPLARKPGGYRQLLLGPSDQIYLADRTAKCFRLDLFLDDGSATEAEKRAAMLAASAPLWPMPDLPWTRHTGAFGVHGGPAPGPGKASAQTSLTVFRWQVNADFGPFGGFGDVKDAAAQGTPRNGPCALHNVLRWASGPLLTAAEGMVMQHCLRPPPGRAPRLPPGTKPFRVGLSDRTIQAPHGFTALDYEHFSIDLLFDYYWLTGDPLALMEMRRTVAGLPTLLAGLPFLTCRGEGWCMQAAALHEMATGDRALLDFVRQRFRNDVQPKLGPKGASWVLRQPPHKDAFGPSVFFDAPWQMAAFVHGLHAMYRRTGDAMFRDAVLRTARVMADPGWLEGTGPKYLVSALDPGRYTLPVGYGPLEGTAIMQTGAFVLAEKMAADVDDKQLFRRRARFIYAPYEKAEPEVNAANPWFQLMLDRWDKDS